MASSGEGEGAESKQPTGDEPTIVQTQAPPGARARTIAVGDVLNHMFEVKRFIKAGGVGQVFEGSNVMTGERVAIKALLPSLAADPKVIALFQREATTLTRLNHEALVQYRTLAKEPQSGILYIVTEFVDGVELGESLGRIDRNEDELRLLMARLASGLAAAHKLGAIHRDMSPDNVMLPGGDLHNAKIIDFGIAKDTESALQTLIGAGFAGKLNYVAPEQLGEHGGEIGPWTDVYSLALVMLAVAGGKRVDMAGSFADAIHKRRAGVDVSAAPEGLRPLLAAMLKLNPAERIRSMPEVLASLGAAAEAEDTARKAAEALLAARAAVEAERIAREAAAAEQAAREAAAAEQAAREAAEAEQAAREAAEADRLAMEAVIAERAAVEAAAAERAARQAAEAERAAQETAAAEQAAREAAEAERAAQEAAAAEQAAREAAEAERAAQEAAAAEQAAREAAEAERAAREAAAAEQAAREAAETERMAQEAAAAEQAAREAAEAERAAQEAAEAERAAQEAAAAEQAAREAAEAERAAQEAAAAEQAAREAAEAERIAREAAQAADAERAAHETEESERAAREAAEAAAAEQAAHEAAEAAREVAAAEQAARDAAVAEWTAQEAAEREAAEREAAAAAAQDPNPAQPAEAGSAPDTAAALAPPDIPAIVYAPADAPRRRALWPVLVAILVVVAIAAAALWFWQPWRMLAPAPAPTPPAAPAPTAPVTPPTAAPAPTPPISVPAAPPDRTWLFGRWCATNAATGREAAWTIAAQGEQIVVTYPGGSQTETISRTAPGEITTNDATYRRTPSGDGLTVEEPGTPPQQFGKCQ